jgi:hypothetical protein
MIAFLKRINQHVYINLYKICDFGLYFLYVQSWIIIEHVFMISASIFNFYSTIYCNISTRVQEIYTCSIMR